MKGRTLGVTGLGSSTNFLTQYLCVKAGVPLGEFTSIGVGAGTTFIAAMQQKLLNEVTAALPMRSAAARTR